jgi:hypothetical protein
VGRKQMTRSLVAVVLGFVVMVVGVVAITAAVAKVLPASAPANGQPAGTGYLILSLLYCYGFAVLGGYVTGWAAGRAPLVHAIGLGIAMAAMFTAFLKVNADGQPHWYEYALLGTAAPAIWGGYLRSRQVRAHGVLLKKKLEALDLMGPGHETEPEDKDMRPGTTLGL